MNVKYVRHTALLLAALSLTALAFAGVPQSINYQGYLKNSDGSPVTAATSITFSLYSSTSGAGAVWNSNQGGTPGGARVSVTPVNGIYNVELGASPQPALPPFSRQHWLGIKVGNDPEMRPLQALNSMPYALRAAVAEDVKIQAGQFMYIASGAAINNTLAPRCSCDQDSNTRECPSRTYSNTDFGVICYDVYDSGGSEDPETGEYIPNFYSQPFTRNVSAQPLLEAGKYGGIGINTKPSEYDLDVNGTVRGTKFIGDGSGLTNLSISASSVTGTVGTTHGGTGTNAQPTASGQYLRSSAPGIWGIGGIQTTDLPNLSGTYVDLANSQTIRGDKTFTNQVQASGGLKINGSGNGVTFPNATVQKTAKTDCMGRYEDNGDGTVTDCRSGLIWLKDANCTGWRTWADAMAWASSLANGYCGLTDESHAGDWRLPTKTELMAMVASGKKQGFTGPVIPNSAGTSKWVEGDPFKNLQSHFYWTSSTHPDGDNFAWTLSLNIGAVYGWTKTTTYWAWPVRAGQ